MRKYRLYGTVTGSIYIGEVEANSEEEAIEKGYKLDSAQPSFCYQCSALCEDPEVVIECAESDEEE